MERDLAVSITSAAAKKTSRTMDSGLPSRIVMAMATEMADMRRTTNQACVLFTTLAAAIGVDVTNAMEL
jgi:hypothetical protein